MLMVSVSPTLAPTWNVPVYVPSSSVAPLKVVALAIRDSSRPS
jgi:hypothetical protein